MLNVAHIQRNDTDSYDSVCHYFILQVFVLVSMCIISVCVTSCDVNTLGEAKVLNMASFFQVLWSEHCLQKNMISLHQCGVSFIHAVRMFNQLRQNDLKKDEVDEVLDAMDVERDTVHDGETPKDFECSQGAAATSAAASAGE